VAKITKNGIPDIKPLFGNLERFKYKIQNQAGITVFFRCLSGHVTTEWQGPLSQGFAGQEYEYGMGSGRGDGEEETAAERAFVMGDIGIRDQNEAAPDYESGMGSGRPANEEGKGTLLGSEEGHRNSKISKFIDSAERMFHKGKWHEDEGDKKE